MVKTAVGLKNYFSTVYILIIIIIVIPLINIIYLIIIAISINVLIIYKLQIHIIYTEILNGVAPMVPSLLEYFPQ